MKNFFKNYQKQKRLKNIYIVLGAFLFAFSLNFLIFDGQDLSNSLKTSVLDSSKNLQNFGDFYLEKAENKVFLKNSKKMSSVNNFSFSIVYDAENLQIANIKSKFSEVQVLGEKGTGLETFIIYTGGKNLDLNEVLAEIEFEKKDKQKVTQINLLNSNFTDTSESIYSLTTSGINL